MKFNRGRNIRKVKFHILRGENRESLDEKNKCAKKTRHKSRILEKKVSDNNGPKHIVTRKVTLDIQYLVGAEKLEMNAAVPPGPWYDVMRFLQFL